jgi:molecular chaperone HscB
VATRVLRPVLTSLHMNYFDFFQLPVRLQTDTQVLRARYIEKSKQLHPDYFTNASPAEQEEAERQTALNNKAYQTLVNPDTRLRHVLELNGLLQEDQSYQMPPDFLMEVMDLNERLMSLEFDASEGLYEEALKHTQELEKQLEGTAQEAISRFDSDPSDDTALQSLSAYYFKKRYLLRIKENLAKFASSTQSN